MSDFRFQDEFEDDKLNVYLAGPLSDYETPQQTHTAIIQAASEYLPEINFIDPMKLEPEYASGWEMIRKDLTCVEDADAVFAYRPAGCESWGTQAEIRHAQKVNTPVVIYNMDGSDFNHWMHLPFTVEEELETCFDALGALARIYG